MRRATAVAAAAGRGQVAPTADRPRPKTVGLVSDEELRGWHARRLHAAERECAVCMAPGWLVGEGTAPTWRQTIVECSGGGGGRHAVCADCAHAWRGDPRSRHTLRSRLRCPAEGCSGCLPSPARPRRSHANDQATWALSEAAASRWAADAPSDSDDDVDDEEEVDVAGRSRSVLLRAADDGEADEGVRWVEPCLACGADVAVDAKRAAGLEATACGACGATWCGRCGGEWAADGRSAGRPSGRPKKCATAGACAGGCRAACPDGDLLPRGWSRCARPTTVAPAKGSVACGGVLRLVRKGSAAHAAAAHAAAARLTEEEVPSVDCPTCGAALHKSSACNQLRHCAHGQAACWACGAAALPWEGELPDGHWLRCPRWDQQMGLEAGREDASGEALAEVRRKAMRAAWRRELLPPLQPACRARPLRHGKSHSDTEELP